MMVAPLAVFPARSVFLDLRPAAARVMVTAPPTGPPTSRADGVPRSSIGSGLASTFSLRFATACKGCGRALAVGANAYKGPGKGAGVRCALCGPFPLPEATVVTRLPDGRAEGAYGHQDGLRPMMTKKAAAGIAKSRGGAGLSEPEPVRGKRKRRGKRPG